MGLQGLFYELIHVFANGHFSVTRVTRFHTKLISLYRRTLVIYARYIFICCDHVLSRVRGSARNGITEVFLAQLQTRFLY
jgi:hypothetical protein